MKIIDKKQPIKASDLLHYNTPKMRNNKDTNPKEKAKIHRHPKQRNTVQKLYALPFPTKIHTPKKEKAERTDRSVLDVLYDDNILCTDKQADNRCRNTEDHKTGKNKAKNSYLKGWAVIFLFIFIHIYSPYENYFFAFA